MKPQNPRRPRRSYDTFHMGRSCMDLYSNDVGADFVHIRSFAALDEVMAFADERGGL